MIIQVLCDSPDSWMNEHAIQFVEDLKGKGLNASFISNPAMVQAGDILIMLSCEQVFKNLHLNKYNLVVHESDLPRGKGWSPLTWQILEGKNQISVTLFEAMEKVDAGPIYGQTLITLDGTELVDELRNKQAQATIQLLENFILNFQENIGKPQEGESTFYPKRTQADSELDIQKSIKDQFNLLRVCDNERYPAHFYLNNQKFIIKIYKDK